MLQDSTVTNETDDRQQTGQDEAGRDQGLLCSGKVEVRPVQNGASLEHAAGPLQHTGWSGGATGEGISPASLARGVVGATVEQDAGGGGNVEHAPGDRVRPRPVVQDGAGTVGSLAAGSGGGGLAAGLTNNAGQIRGGLQN